MKREIKFRAYSKKFKDLQPTYFDKDGWFVMGDGEVGVEEKDIMQFTGLKDKNGVEIFEGDIVKDLNGKNYEVFFNSAVGCFQRTIEGKRKDIGNETILAPTFHNEVIGNIYENSNLLEDAKK